MPDNLRERIPSSSKVKIALGVLSLLFALFSIGGTLLLLGQKQEPRKLAEGSVPGLTCGVYDQLEVYVINSTSEPITTTVRWMAKYCEVNDACTCDGQLTEETVTIYPNIWFVREMENMHPDCGPWAWRTYIEGPCTAEASGCGYSGCCDCGPTPSTCLTPGVSPTPTAKITPTPLQTPTPTPILTPSPTKEITGTPTPGITVTPTLGPSLTPTPTSYSGYCEHCWAYDQNWIKITDFSGIWAGQTIFLATKGVSTSPQGVTKARFRVNGGSWQETTTKHGNEFYIEYPIPVQGEYTVESMIYIPELGNWF